MNIILFLGSGTSIPSGLPSVEQLTGKVLNGKYYKHTDSRFRSYAPPGIPDADKSVKLIQSFLSRIYLYSNDYLSKKWKKQLKTNYEDLYYLADQIYQEEGGTTDNSALAPFLKYIENELATILNISVDKVTKEEHLVSTSRQTRNFIESVVFNSLCVKASPQLNFLQELNESSRIDKIFLFTTNHDLLVEDQFAGQITDGFGAIDGGLRLYDPKAWDGAEYKAQLFKLHGSVNWYSYENVQNGKTEYCIRLPNQRGDYISTSDGDSNFQISTIPKILTGGNKLLKYNTGIFADLQYHFQKILNENSLMIMSGYGWNDAGINMRLFTWLRNEYNRIILLHENPEQIRDDSKSTMFIKYDNLVKEC
jgi:hypothetical protein